MFIAYDHNNQIVSIDNAHSNQEYYCPGCGAPLTTKMGDTRAHHFAHRKGFVCRDTWETSHTYDVSDWHKNWQQLFPETNQEIYIRMGEICHRADVVISNTVIEFQHSIMSAKAFEDRNNYYQNLSYKVIWLFDMCELIESGELYFEEDDDKCLGIWKNPKKAFKEHSFLDGNVDLFFQINDSDENCIVRVLKTSENGFESFDASRYMDKEEFLAYVGLENGVCEIPYSTYQANNTEYLEFKKKYHIDLDPKQERAMLAVNGPVLLLAVPGSGKTTVLVNRLGYMVLCKGISPESILAITYNKKASDEMKDRFAEKFGTELADRITFRTINALSYAIYKNYYSEIAPIQKTLVPNRGGLLKSIYSKFSDSNPSENEIRELDTYISYIKNMHLSDEEIFSVQTDLPDLLGMYKYYQETLLKNNWMDFDDQMSFAYSILANNPKLLSEVRARYKYICVDEAQDTSKIQHDIIRLLADGNNLFMVGDEDQSIYGFRAAYPQALLNFRYDYKNPYILRIEKNYRSTSPITDLAQSFVSKNKGRYNKVMTSARGSGEAVSFIDCSTREDQFNSLLSVAKDHSRETAFLFRNNESSIVLTDMFLRNNIDFELQSPKMMFFETKVVKDVLAYLSLSINPYDYESLGQIINKGIFFLKKKPSEFAINNVRYKGMTVWDALEGQMSYVAYKYRDRADNFRNEMNHVSHKTPSEAIDLIMDLGYTNYCENNHLDTNKVDSLKLLAKQERDIPSFLKRIAYLKKTLENDIVGKSETPVILSTIHSSKGLEYEAVYLFDVYDGFFPSTVPDIFHMSKDSADAWQEERRLLYVGMTRAKDKLVLMRIKDRRSSFVDELCSDVLMQDFVVPGNSRVRNEYQISAKKLNNPKKEKARENGKRIQEATSHFFKDVNAISVQRRQEEEKARRLADEKEQGLQEVQLLIMQQEIKAVDSFGRHWVVCERCGEIKTSDEFVAFGGWDHVNLGVCRDCSKI